MYPARAAENARNVARQIYGEHSGEVAYLNAHKSHFCEVDDTAPADVVVLLKDDLAAALGSKIKGKRLVTLNVSDPVGANEVIYAHVLGRIEETLRWREKEIRGTAA